MNELRYKDKHLSGSISQEFKVTARELWYAVTDPDQMRSWFFENIPDFKPEVGFKTSFTVDTGERKFIHLWEIEEVIPGKKLVYLWRYQDYEGESYVIFNVETRPDGSCLLLQYYGADTFPRDIPEFRKESVSAGWEYFIAQQLVHHLGS